MMTNKYKEYTAAFVAWYLLLSSIFFSSQPFSYKNVSLKALSSFAPKVKFKFLIIMSKPCISDIPIVFTCMSLKFGKKKRIFAIVESIYSLKSATLLHD